MTINHNTFSGIADARVLIVNDDGIDAHGIKMLERIVKDLCDDVWIVAPTVQQSATGHSLTLRRPLRIINYGPKKFAVDGTPTDCVLLAVNQIMKDSLPDFVLSGINHGQNVGEDMTYSGTIAAAIEGTLSGIPSIALSQAMNAEDFRNTGNNVSKSYSAASRFVADVLKIITELSFPKDVLLSVNFPPSRDGNIAGIEVTRSGTGQKFGDHILQKQDPRGHPYYWIGERKCDPRELKGTDVEAIAKNTISVTPISVDLTHDETVNRLKDAFKKISSNQRGSV
ncbi:MAG: 5'/3'-nucleotidase SurE [Pseudomonadota bacterium]|nr:5'/3'-nucleotidase SurE [Pseudomonadota bacterium]